MAGLQQSRSAALAGKVQRANELADTGERAGVHRVLPVLPGLRSLLPGQGLRRGTIIAVKRGAQPATRQARSAHPITRAVQPGGAEPATSRRAEVRPVALRATGPVMVAQPGSGAVVTSLVLALLAEASRNGSWCAVVGVPTLGAAAAAELGIALDRLALVPYPGPEWVNVVAALVDGVDVVVVAPSGPVAAQVASRLAARARQRGCVLVPLISWSGAQASPSGRWEGADVILESVRGAWEGLGQGHGRLRCREVTISARGRGAATRRRQIQIWLPATPDGWIGAETGTAKTPRRPTLTVIDGGADPAVRRRAG